MDSTLNRRSFSGGFAYGIPWNLKKAFLRMSVAVEPRRVPCSIVTLGSTIVLSAEFLVDSLYLRLVLTVILNFF